MRDARSMSPCPSMQKFAGMVNHEIFHPRIGGLLSGLIEQDHQDDPFELVEIDIVIFQRHHTVNDQLTRRAI